MRKLILFILLFLLIGCQQEEKRIVIAEQYGLAYAPVQVMKEKKILEEKLPEYEIVWLKLGNTAAIREAMIADELDAAFVGIPPFLIGYENGVDWKIMNGLSRAPLALMANKEIASLKELNDTDLIALPQPGSIQHILLSMAAERILGDASYFDNQIVSMKHPDGQAALLSGSVTYHFTSPPYLFDEKEEGMTQVIDGETCMNGPFTFIVGVGTSSLIEDEEAYQAFQLAMDESLTFMEENQLDTIELLMPYYDYEEKQLSEYLYDSGIFYEKSIHGLDTFIDFMVRNNYLKSTYTEDDLIW